MFDVAYCPNVKCSNKKSMHEDQRCPNCNTPAQKFGLSEATILKTKKVQREKIDTGAKEILVSDRMSDEEIKEKIIEDMVNLSMHEAGTGWMRLGTLLSGNSTDQILGAGLKAIIDQNKIIIRQNELIFRTLTKTMDIQKNK